MTPEEKARKFREWADKNREHLREYRRAYRQRDPALTKARYKAWVEKNREYVKEQKREYRKKYPERHREWERTKNQRHKEKIAVRNAEYRRKHPEKQRAYSQKWADANKEKHSDWYYRKRHGISKAEARGMLTRQGGKCLICLSALGEKWHLDHDHKTGEKRGVLCGLCNTGLGYFKDDPHRLMAAATYLLKRVRPACEAI